MPASPRRAAPAARPRQGSDSEPSLYTWEELGTTQRQAALDMMYSVRVRRRRSRRLAVVLTLLLVVLLLAAAVAVVVLWPGSPLPVAL